MLKNYKKINKLESFNLFLNENLIYDYNKVV